MLESTASTLRGLSCSMLSFCSQMAGPTNSQHTPDGALADEEHRIWWMADKEVQGTSRIDHKPINGPSQDDQKEITKSWENS